MAGLTIVAFDGRMFAVPSLLRAGPTRRRGARLRLLLPPLPARAESLGTVYQIIQVAHPWRRHGRQRDRDLAVVPTPR